MTMDGLVVGTPVRARVRVCIYVVYTRRTLSGVVCDLTRFDLI